MTIGLAEDPQRYVDAGYTPTRSTIGQQSYFKRFGMPLLMQPRARVSATSRACRAIVATRLLLPGPRGRGAARAAARLVHDHAAARRGRRHRAGARARRGLDVDAVVAAIDAPETLAAYEDDKQQTRSAEGGPTDFQGKARQTDGPVRYSAPSLVFHSAGGQRLEAGGFQTIEAYDVLIANLDPTLEREAPPDEAIDALRRFPDGLVTAEVAAILAQNNQLPDRDSAERALIELVGSGAVTREALGRRRALEDRLKSLAAAG